MSGGRLAEGAAPPRNDLIPLYSCGFRGDCNVSPLVWSGSWTGVRPVRNVGFCVGFCRVFAGFCKILTASCQISPQVRQVGPGRLRAARSGGAILADEQGQILRPRLDGVGRTAFRDGPPTGLQHPGPSGTATRPFGRVAFRTGFVGVVTGFGNDEIRVVTGLGNDDIKVVTGFGSDGSRALYSFWTDAARGTRAVRRRSKRED